METFNVLTLMSSPVNMSPPVAHFIFYKRHLAYFCLIISFLTESLPSDSFYELAYASCDSLHLTVRDPKVLGRE